MKKHILRIALILVLLVTVGTAAAFSVYPKQHMTHEILSLEEEGILKGAEYKIRVPREWNGTLLVFAHGYTTEWYPPRVAPGYLATSAEQELFDQGYALAGSSFSSPGWAIKEGIQNTKDLVLYFHQRVGKPEHVIVWGESLGAGVALKCIEQYPYLFDGAISEGGPIAGLPMQADWFLGFSLAYDVTFGWPEDWGPLGNLRDDISFMDDVLPTILAQFPDPLNYGKWEFIRLVTDYPIDAFWGMAPPEYGGVPWPFLNFMFATEGFAALEQTARGTVMQNLDHVYNLTEDEINYLEGLGVDTSSLLAEMNASTDIKASRWARRYLERYFEFSGRIKGPVITIHNTGDPLCIEAHTDVYRDVVMKAGRGFLLFQVFNDSVGHCNFTKQQYVLTVNAMKAWLDGTNPSTQDWGSVDLLTVPPYEPPSWPFTE